MTMHNGRCSGCGKYVGRDRLSVARMGGLATQAGYCVGCLRKQWEPKPAPKRYGPPEPGSPVTRSETMKAIRELLDRDLTRTARRQAPAEREEVRQAAASWRLR